MGEFLSLAAYVKVFVAMIVIVNPVGIMPVFVAMTMSQSDRQRHEIARIAAITVACTLLVSVLFGEKVLEVFGISMAAFKVAGAILIMLNAVAMMQAMPARDKQTPEEAQEAEDKDKAGASIAVVPLGLPLLAGPGAMSTILIYASQKKSVGHMAAVSVVVLAVSITVWLALRVATRIGNKLSTTTLNVATRIMGLLLAALAVEIFSSGIVELIPALGKPDVFRYGQ
jgi:multiple antibiotic resistance protein